MKFVVLFQSNRIIFKSSFLELFSSIDYESQIVVSILWSEWLFVVACKIFKRKSNMLQVKWLAIPDTIKRKMPRKMSPAWRTLIVRLFPTKEISLVWLYKLRCFFLNNCSLLGYMSTFKLLHMMRMVAIKFIIVAVIEK